MSEQEEAEREDWRNPIDRSVKALAQRVPGAFFRLIGLDYDPEAVWATDVAVNLPEHRADGVFVVGEGLEQWALHLEYQFQPDGRVLPGWFLKNAALTVQLGCRCCWSPSISGVESEPAFLVRMRRVRVH